MDKHAIHSSLWLEAGEFLLFYADGEPDLGPEHLEFKLSSEGGSVGLFADGAAVKTVGQETFRVSTTTTTISTTISTTTSGAAVTVDLSEGA